MSTKQEVELIKIESSSYIIFGAFEEGGEIDNYSGIIDVQSKDKIQEITGRLEDVYGDSTIKGSIAEILLFVKQYKELRGSEIIPFEYRLKQRNPGLFLGEWGTLDPDLYFASGMDVHVPGGYHKQGLAIAKLVGPYSDQREARLRRDGIQFEEATDLEKLLRKECLSEK